MYPKYLLLTIIILGISLTANAQFPATSIYSFEYEMEGDTLWLDKPEYLTGFNKFGYNNQPSFFNTNEVYISTNMYNDSLTEIVKLDLRNKRLYRVTDTEESEYSPTLSPNPRFFSCVRIERNRKDQSLWLYPVDRSSYGRRLLEDLDNVGYHTWISEDELVLFHVGTPNTLVKANASSGNKITLLENIGRCMRLNGNSELVFVHKITTNRWYLKSYDLITRKIKILTETFPNKEDFELLPDGSIIMGNGSELYRYEDTGVNAKWHKIDDFSPLGINNISRMAISQNKLLIVNVKNR